MRSITLPAAVYVRISDDKEGAGLGVARQRQDCEKRAAELDLAVSPVDYTDNDVSAYSGKSRAGYERLLDDITGHRIGAVIAWHTDRLHRSPTELERYITITEKIPTYTVTGGLLDLSTPSGRLAARQFGAIARYESEHRAERIARKHQQSAELGRWRGGTRAFGYAADGMALDPAEAALVRGAYATVIAGGSLGSIIRAWNEQGITTTTGKAWSYATLRQVLLRQRNYGASVYRGRVVGRGEWETLVDERTWRTTQAILTDGRRRQSSSNVGRHLLAGLALCAVCGTPVKSGSTSGPRSTPGTLYRCPAGSHVYRRADYIDDYVKRVAIERLSRTDAAEALVPPAAAGHPAGAGDEADRIRERLAELPKLFAELVLTADEVRDAKAVLTARLREVEDRLIDPQQIPELADLADAKDPGALWDEMSWRQRRTVVNALMVVHIEPVGRGRARTFHAESVQISWK